ncbi:MAG: hypothetical protein EPN82_05920 [Bacteroidetes bacterium]|nr:MAG: hypothetical protein EPN82_05920 [Bacteroidota bacterium]
MNLRFNSLQINKLIVNGNYQAAYEAISNYCPSNTKDKIFWESKNIECLFKLIHNGRFDLYSKYIGDVESFLNVYSDEELNKLFYYNDDALTNALQIKRRIEYNFYIDKFQEKINLKQYNEARIILHNYLSILDTYWGCLDYIKIEYISNVYKLLAFSWLRDDTFKSSPAVVLSEAGEYFQKAINIYEVKVIETNKIENEHYFYLSFWHQITIERLMLCNYMSTGNNKDLELLKESYSKLEMLAIFNKNKKIHPHLYPNRFYSFYDLMNEKLFIEAASFFKNKELNGCREKLELLVSKFSEEYLYSWKYNQFYLRLLFVKVLQYHEKKEIVKQIINEGETFKLICGKVGRYFLDLINGYRNTKKIINNDEFYNEICKKFPLDSWEEEFSIEDDFDSRFYLPKEIYYDLLNHSQPMRENDINVDKYYILCCIESIIGYILDYYIQYTELNYNIEFNLKNDINVLIKILQSLNYNINLDVEFSEIIRIYDKLHEDINLDEYSQLLRDLNIIISKKIISIFPIVTEILSTNSIKKDKYIIKSIPSWALSYKIKYKSNIYLFINNPELFKLSNGFYYISRRARKNPMHLINKTNGILPVLFKPRWDYWINNFGINKPILYVEGPTDVKYIKRAALLLNKQDLINNIKIVSAKSEGELDKIWKSAKSALNIELRFKIILLYDPECKNQTSANEKNIYKRKMILYSNNPIKKGIENLFSIYTIKRIRNDKKEFVDYYHPSIIEQNGSNIEVSEKYEINEGNKDKLCSWLVEYGTQEDFTNFKHIFEYIEDILNNVN